MSPTTSSFTPSANHVSKLPHHSHLKRRLLDLQNDLELTSLARLMRAQKSRPSSSSSSSSTSSSSHRFKRQKTPHVIGQQLPVSRLIEVLDHSSLQSLVHTILHTHPEISTVIQNSAPCPNLALAIALSRQKLALVLDNLPYKCEAASDYLYLRIKPLLTDFLHCLSDFVLHFLPPVAFDIEVAVSYLDEATTLIFKIPNFSNSEFQYTRSVAFEQIGNTWLAALSGLRDKPGSSLSDTDLDTKWDLHKLVKDHDLLRKLGHYNEMSGNMFKPVCDYIHSELVGMDALNCSVQANDVLSPGLGLLGDLITLDYTAFSLATQSSN